MAEVMLDESVPMSPYMQRCACVSIAGQIDQTPVGIECVKIDGLSPSGGFAGASQCFLLANRVDCARFARIGTSRKCDLGADICWKLLDSSNAAQQLGVVIGSPHGIPNELISG